MDESVKVKPPPTPLSGRNKKGNVYGRTREVEDQIREALSLDPVTLIMRAQISDYEHDEYLKEECIVHLIRHYLERGEKRVTSDLFEALYGRCVAIVYAQLMPLEQRFADDAFKDVIDKLTDKILDIRGNQGDFLQVRFQFVIKRLAITAFKRFIKMQNRESIPEALDPPEEFDGDLAGLEKDLIPKEMYERLKIGLLRLDEPRRIAFHLYHGKHWPIESKNPKIPTISKHLRKTPKTIRTWLAESKEFLRRYCEGEV